jgi:hypothetical protein
MSFYNKTNGQAKQDFFVLSVLKEKKNGYFVEIGSNDPKFINNTYILEKEYGWKGLMVEYDSKWENLYKIHRSNSDHIINDATQIDYLSFFRNSNYPLNMDYLQIDLEVNNRSTLNVLEIFDRTIFDTYKFATITFEHDIYTGNHFNTREISRNIFEKWGYIRVFSDVSNDIINKYEDWYVHPNLVDMDYINKIKTDQQLDWTQIVKIL